MEEYHGFTSALLADKISTAKCSLNVLAYLLASRTRNESVKLSNVYAQCSPQMQQIHFITCQTTV